MTFCKTIHKVLREPEKHTKIQVASGLYNLLEIHMHCMSIPPGKTRAYDDTLCTAYFYSAIYSK